MCSTLLVCIHHTRDLERVLLCSPSIRSHMKGELSRNKSAAKAPKPKSKKTGGSRKLVVPEQDQLSGPRLLRAVWIHGRTMPQRSAVPNTSSIQGGQHTSAGGAATQGDKPKFDVLDEPPPQITFNVANANLTDPAFGGRMSSSIPEGSKMCCVAGPTERTATAKHCLRAMVFDTAPQTYVLGGKEFEAHFPSSA